MVWGSDCGLVINLHCNIRELEQRKNTNVPPQLSETLMITRKWLLWGCKWRLNVILKYRIFPWYQNDIPKFYKTLPVNLVLEFCVCQSINILDQRLGVIKKIFSKDISERRETEEDIFHNTIHLYSSTWIAIDTWYNYFYEFSILCSSLASTTTRQGPEPVSWYCSRPATTRSAVHSKESDGSIIDIPSVK